MVASSSNGAATGFPPLPPQPPQPPVCESCRSAPGFPFCRVQWSFHCAGCAPSVFSDSWIIGVNPNPSLPFPCPFTNPNPNPNPSPSHNTDPNPSPSPSPNPDPDPNPSSRERKRSRSCEKAQAESRQEGNAAGVAPAGQGSGGSVGLYSRDREGGTEDASAANAAGSDDGTSFPEPMALNQHEEARQKLFPSPASVCNHEDFLDPFYTAMLDEAAATEAGRDAYSDIADDKNVSSDIIDDIIANIF